MMNQLKNRILAVVVCFLFIGNNFAFAQQTSTVSDSSPISNLNASAGRVPIDPNASSLGSVLNPYNISIPEQFGQVEEVFQGDANSPLVVHIQNVHANYEAQVNIKGILNYLVEQYQFSLIQLEGAVSKLDPAILQPSYLKEANLKLVDFLMREGRITGADAFAVETNKPVELYGVEDFSLYAENLKMFKSIYKHQVELKPYFDEVHRLILNVGPKLLNPELLDFTRKTEEFSTDKIDFLDYLVYMNQLSEKHKLVSLNELPTMVDYPNLTRLMRLRSLEEKLNKAGLKKETEAIKAEFRKKMPGSEKVEELLSHLDESAKGVNPRTYFLELTQLADEAKIDFVAYPAFRIFAEFLIHQDEIDHRVLFAEIKQFEDMLQEKLFTAEDEKMFLSIIDRVGLLEQFFRLEMSREKIALYLKGRQTVTPSRIFSDLDELAKKMTVASKPVGDLPALDSYMADVEYFYQLVLKRDEVFIDKILSKTKSLSLDKTIIVTGGFHKDGLIDYFRKEKISYVIINPKVDVKEGNQNYLKVMLEEDAVAGSVFAGTFAAEVPSYANPDMKAKLALQVFAPGVSITQLTPDFDLTRTQAKLDTIRIPAGVNYQVKNVTRGFTSTQTAEAQFFTVNGKPEGIQIAGEIDENSIFSERMVGNIPISERDLEKVGIVKHQPPSPMVRENLPDITSVVSLGQPSRVLTLDGLFKNSILFGLFIPGPFTSVDGRARPYFNLLASSTRAELRLIDARIQDGIPALEELARIREKASEEKVLSAKKISNAGFGNKVSSTLAYLSTSRTTQEQVFLAFSVSNKREVAEAQISGLIQSFRQNPVGKTVAVLYVKKGTKDMVEALGIPQEYLASIIVVERGDSVDKTRKQMYDAVTSGSIANHFLKFGLPKDEVMKRLGVIVDADDEQERNNISLIHPEIIQLVNFERAELTNDAAEIAVNFNAVKILAKITGVEHEILRKQLAEAGLEMKDLGRNQWGMAETAAFWVGVYGAQRQLEISA